MVTKAEKDAKENILRSLDDTIRDVGRKFREDSGGGGSNASAFSALEKLRQEYETVDMKILRKNTDTNRYELFLRKPDMSVDEVMGFDWEATCQDEGGRGDYKVEAWFPPKEGGKAPIRQQIGRFNVGGDMTYPTPMSELKRRQAEGFSPMGMMQSMMGLPSNTINPKGQDSAMMRDMLKYVGDSSQHQTNNMMNMLGMIMMKDVMGEKAKGPNGQGATPEVQLLKEELKQMKADRDRDRDRRELEDRLRRSEDAQREADRRHQDMMRELGAKIDGKGGEKDLTLELMKLREVSGNKGEDNWLKFMMMSREDNSAAQGRNDALMMKMFEKPDGIDQSSKIMNMMMENSVSQLNLISQIAQSGLLGGGQDHPVIDLVRDGIESARDVLSERFKAQGAMAGYEDDDEGETPLPIQAPPTEVTRGELPEGESAEGEEGEQPPEITPEGLINDPEQLDQLLLTDDELMSVAKDNAGQQVLKCVSSGDLRQATARIFALANSGKVPYQKWFMAPGPVSGQILASVGLAKFMLVLPQDMMEFNEFINGGGDPNEWSEEYNPVKKAPTGGKKMKQGPSPEFGMEVQDPKPGELVDASELPSGVDPAVVEQQRAVRSKKAQLAKMEEVLENIDRLKKGKLPAAQVQHWRGEGLLPPEGQEDAAIEEITVAIAETKKELGIEDKPPEPEPPAEPDKEPEPDPKAKEKDDA